MIVCIRVNREKLIVLTYLLLLVGKMFKQKSWRESLAHPRCHILSTASSKGISHQGTRTLCILPAVCDGNLLRTFPDEMFIW